MLDSANRIVPETVLAPAGVVLSFDDYSETWITHLPLLEALGIKTTFFITGNFVRDVHQAENRLHPLLDAGHSLGVHTFSHRRATEMWLNEGQHWVNTDVIDQANLLRQLAGKAIRVFAYPHGDRNEDTDFALLSHFHVLRAFGKKTYFTTQQRLQSGGIVYATSIDNIHSRDDSWYDHQLNQVSRRSMIWAVASHHIDDSKWGITPARLERFARLAHAKGIQIHRFEDFMP